MVATPSINVRKTILTYTDEEFDRVVTINMKGNFNVLRAAGRIMTEQRSGSIVLFSSIRSLVVEPGQGVYAATKAAIVQLVRTAAAEFGPSGVRVNAVAPGVVETPLTAPIKANNEWYDAYSAKSVLKPVGAAGGDRGAHRVPRLGRRQLRDRHRPVRRRRLDGRRRPLPAARDVTAAARAPHRRHRRRRHRPRGDPGRPFRAGRAAAHRAGFALETEALPLGLRPLRAHRPDDGRGRRSSGCAPSTRSTSAPSATRRCPTTSRSGS